MTIRPLALYDDFTREDIHDIFAPETPFTPQAGMWGISGLIELPGRVGDFAFLVIFGQSQGEHDFDEGITDQGILRWQSQPRQSLADRLVGRLIAHNEDTNTIHLFLRTAGRRQGAIVPYTYLGRLQYDGHDSQRERPVHFRWQLLDWPMPTDVVERMALRLEMEGVNPSSTTGRKGILLEEEPPLGVPDLSGSTRSFRAARQRRPTEEENRALGLAGELLVLRHERERLLRAGLAQLSASIVHTSAIEGDGAGFDIRRRETPVHRGKDDDRSEGFGFFCERE